MLGKFFKVICFAGNRAISRLFQIYMNGRSSFAFSLSCAVCLWAGLAVGQAPMIDSFSPASGPVGTPVTLSGANFSATPSNNIVYFGAVRAMVIGVNTNSLLVLAPAGATCEPITVTTGRLTGASKLPFIVTFGGSQALRFDPPQQQHFAADSAGPLSIGDYDGDGRPDVTTVATFPGQQNGTSVGGFLLFQNLSTPGTLDSTSLAPAQPIDPNYPGTSGSYARAAVTVDLDGDGKLDVVEMIYFGDFVLFHRNIGPQVNPAGGIFAPPAFIEVPSSSASLQGLAVADLDGPTLAIAARVGLTRLIDNVPLSEGDTP